MSLVLAFDIERTGPSIQDRTIAIGASVVDENLVELDSIFLPCYFEHDTKFDPQCWSDFWSKPTNLKVLETLKYKGKLDRFEREAEMIKLFQAFRYKWEVYAEKFSLKFELVSDNNVFDGGFINQLIFTYLPKEKPIPYSASTGQYCSFWETHSQQRGLLLLVDPKFVQTKDWGYTEHINKLYNVPEKSKTHDHNPVNDAYCIAFDQQILLGIRKGSIKKRTAVTT